MRSKIINNLQTTAKIAPTRAIHTTLTADGTRVAYCVKCNLASKNPNADDFIAVSIAMVRDWTSVKFNALGILQIIV